MEHGQVYFQPIRMPRQFHKGVPLKYHSVHVVKTTQPPNTCVLENVGFFWFYAPRNKKQENKNPKGPFQNQEKKPMQAAFLFLPVSPLPFVAFSPPNDVCCVWCNATKSASVRKVVKKICNLVIVFIHLLMKEWPVPIIVESRLFFFFSCFWFDKDFTPWWCHGHPWAGRTGSRS